MNKLTSVTGIYNSILLLRSFLMKPMEVQLALIKPLQGLSCGSHAKRAQLRVSGHTGSHRRQNGVSKAFIPIISFKWTEKCTLVTRKAPDLFPKHWKYCKSVEALFLFSQNAFPHASESRVSPSRKFIISATFFSIFFFFAACKFRENRFQVGDDT